MQLCPNCGQDIEKDYTEECEIVCSECHNDFWASEVLDSEDEGKYSLMELRTWGGRV